ncbi:CP4-44 prophage [Escherichia coli]|uniref:CP4-44 prophage n=1 Tax=Escherichia coli TaxID=562 RepID=A0A376MNK5_ECOLX|nr:CP4-44 prophage [Escherichia coli]
MKIITRGEAMRIHQQHPASRLFPFCTGKYRWHGSTETYTGREVQDIPVCWLCLQNVVRTVLARMSG